MKEKPTHAILIERENIGHWSCSFNSNQRENEVLIKHSSTLRETIRNAKKHSSYVYFGSSEYFSEDRISQYPKDYLTLNYPAINKFGMPKIYIQGTQYPYELWMDIENSEYLTPIIDLCIIDAENNAIETERSTWQIFLVLAIIGIVFGFMLSSI